MTTLRLQLLAQHDPLIEVYPLPGNLTENKVTGTESKNLKVFPFAESDGEGVCHSSAKGSVRTLVDGTTG